MRKPALLLFLAILASGCAGFMGQGSAGWDEQAAPEAVRIKALLIEAPDLAGSAIAVEFNQGVVTLGGFVANEEQRRRAAALVSEQGGVTRVVNDIVVK